MKILMVCLGNICRSPLAEGILKAKATQHNLNWIIDSAGTKSYHPGGPPHELSVKVAALKGINISDQCCRQFVKEDLLNFDRIYVMDQNNYNEVKRIAGEYWKEEKVDFIMNETHKGQNISVPDPWYGAEDGYHEVYEMLDKACDAVINKFITQ